MRLQRDRFCGNAWVHFVFQIPRYIFFFTSYEVGHQNTAPAAPAPLSNFQTLHGPPVKQFAHHWSKISLKGADAHLFNWAAHFESEHFLKRIVKQKKKTKHWQ